MSRKITWFLIFFLFVGTIGVGFYYYSKYHQISADSSATQVAGSTTINGKPLSGNIVLDTSNIKDTADKRYVNDTDLLILNKQSGTNTGDETASSIKAKIGKASAYNDGYLSASDWINFSNKGSLNFSTTATGLSYSSTTGVLSLDSGYLIPTTTKASNWDIAFANNHQALTIGTANGLSLSSQELSLGLASGGATGALSGADWTTFNGKQGALAFGNLSAGSNKITIGGTGTGAIIGGGASVDINEANLTHNNLGGLTTGDPHTQYLYLAGRSGGQSLSGGIDANDDITIQGTTHSTRTSSYVILQPNGGNVGIGTSSPNSLLTLQSTSSAEGGVTGSELLLAGDTWTTTNWTGSFPAWTHNTGNTSALVDNTLVPFLASTYKLTYTITGRTAGSVTITFGGISTNAVTATGSLSTRATSGSGSYTVTPTADFDGSLTVSVRQITKGVATFTILDNTAAPNLEMRSFLASEGNTFVGLNSGGFNTTGNKNVAQGSGALSSNTTGYQNVAIGVDALATNTTGYQNTAVGYQALFSNINTGVDLGLYNTAIGYHSMFHNTTGNHNTGLGFNSLLSNTTGVANTALGEDALATITTNGGATAVGSHSLQNSTGGSNTAMGQSSLMDNTSGTYNTAIGDSTGISSFGSIGTVQTDTNMTFLGALASVDKSVNVGPFTNSAAIGYGARVTNSNQIALGSTSITDTILNGNIDVRMSVPGAASGTPGAGGSIANGTYYYVITSLDGAGGETKKGTQSSGIVVSAGGSGSVSLTWTTIAGAASYKVYRSTTSGTYNTPAYIANPTTNSYTDVAASPSVGAPPLNTTAYVNKLSYSGDSWFLGGKIGVGISSPTAYLHLKSGTTAANTAPLKFTSGSLLSTEEAGTIEFLTDTFYMTATNGVAGSTKRQAIPGVTTGTAAPASTPIRVGDIYTDTNNKKVYISTGISSSADWTLLN